MSRTLMHTSLPWAVAETEGGFLVIRADDRDRTLLCDIFGTGPEARANAAFIVRACTSHHELVEALRWTLGRLNDARAVCYGGVTVEQIERCQAVLARAEGK